MKIIAAKLPFGHGARSIVENPLGPDPDHCDTASTNHSLDGGIGMARPYDRKRAQKRSPAPASFGSDGRLAAATSASHAAF